MKIRRFLSVFFVTCLLCTLLTPQALALEDPDIRAKAAILVDADSGTVLYDKNIHQELPMASITKVMSALLVLEAVDRGQLRMDQSITATQSEAVEAYHTAVKLSFERYRTGLSNYIEVLYAQQNLYPAQIQLSQYYYQHASTLVSLYTALGGGWNMSHKAIMDGPSGR